MIVEPSMKLPVSHPACASRATPPARGVRLPEPAPRFVLSAILCLGGWALPSTAGASFLPPEMMASVATYLAWFIIVVVPIAGIVLFWMVHVLPEKIAQKRHHPQQDAIHTLCLLSLVFGGLLWPIAWLWAYTKPIGLQAGLRHRKARGLLPRAGRQGARGRASRGRDRAPARRARRHGRQRRAVRRQLKVLRRELARATPRRHADVGTMRARREQERLMEALLLGIYAFFVWLIFIKFKWLPWNTTSQVTVVDHPDRRADRADPDAQRGRAVDRRRARHQVRRAGHPAGRGRVIEVPVEPQSPGEEGRSAVSHRPDAIPATSSTRRRRNSPPTRRSSRRQARTWPTPRRARGNCRKS